MVRFDDYVLDTLMRDLVGHDRRPAAFLAYMWLVGEEQRRKGEVSISYSELAENIGISKSSAQAAIGWLLRRKLVAARRENVTATPAYRIQTPWKVDYRRSVR
jgi:DNA-binding transcriptional ArsR family regulator